ncbi:DUF4260 domain-containing protein [Polaromonas sp.]|uniref:DUF4260 domain-containing protein n=1 Tax=Polaromonas sp. TaxID=1869339 RepID=UPI00272F5CDD|nr:DUF4260 domain-containing protein [Polaromonas sp.]MDP1740607.1 DUF4260 domain-containing protein [Polaromonas sp.]
MAKAAGFGLLGARLVRLDAGRRPQRAAQVTALPGSAAGGVRTLLRLEGLAALTLALAAYAQFGAGWGWFALLFLLPDLSFAAYLAGPRWGAAAYNAAHSYLGALALLAAGVLVAMPGLLAVGLVWCAHIGFDRTLGYGLKYSEGFGLTHLGCIGQSDPW